MPMNSKNFPKTAAAKAQGSMRTAFGWTPDDEDEKEPVGHTKLDDEEGESFASRVTAGIKKRISR